MKADVCSFEGCDRIVDTRRGGARGLCAKHYRQDSRKRLGETPERMARGEGDEITFRISKADKAAMARFAERPEYYSVAEVYREAVADFLKRRARG